MEKFIPDIYQKSIYTINYEKLKENGIKCLLFDLDNTIVPVGIKSPNKKIKDLFSELKKMGFKVIIFSNSNKKRLEPFKQELLVDCSASSMKPLMKKYRKIMEMFDFNESEIAGIGDQILTDVYGGNKIGITTILVNPVSTKDLYFTLVNRFLERRVFKKLEDNKLFKRGNYYD